MQSRSSPNMDTKEDRRNVSNFLVNIFNRSFSEGLVPHGFKIVVTPLLKKDGLDLDNLNNFRPISNI